MSKINSVTATEKPQKWDGEGREAYHYGQGSLPRFARKLFFDSLLLLPKPALSYHIINFI